MILAKRLKITVFIKNWNNSSYEGIVISNLGLIKIELKMYPFFKIFVPMFEFHVEFKIFQKTQKFNRFLTNFYHVIVNYAPVF